MKRITIIFAALLFFVLSGCQDLDLSSYDKRISDLEDAIDVITSAQNGGDYITGVKELKDSEGNVVGYQITFKDHGTVVVRNGKDGVDGIDGVDGEDGEDGQDGIGVPGKDGDSFFKSVTVKDGFVTFVLEDGRTFSVSLLTFSVADFQLAAKGDGETLTTTMSIAAPVTVTAPEWATVTVDGKNVNIVVEANPDAKEVRYGKVKLTADVDGVTSIAEIILAQAAAGCNIVFDSFAGSELNENWKGDIAGSEARLANGALQFHGVDGTDCLNPLFWYGAKIRRQGSDGYNTIMCTVDVKADGGEGGIQLYNTHGFDGGAYSFDMPNYRYFASSTAGEKTGGFYGWSKGGLAAADPWSSDVTVTEWFRLELGNVERGNGINPDWGAAYIWSLEEDEDGLLQKKDLIWKKEMWWWNDGANMPTTDYGYAAVWGKSPATVTMRNFTLCYTDK